jgi:hypothetical protein
MHTEAVRLGAGMRESALSGSPGALPARGPSPTGGPPRKENWWGRQSTAAKIVLIVVGVIIVIGVIGVATGGGKKKSNGNNSAQEGKARVVITRGSKCWEVPSQARVYAQVHVRNRGNAPGKVDASLYLRYSDAGEAFEPAPDKFTIQPGTVRVAYIAHDYNALRHDVIACSASLDGFKHLTSIRVLAPE